MLRSPAPAARVITAETCSDAIDTDPQRQPLIVAPSGAHATKWRSHFALMSRRARMAIDFTLTEQQQKLKRDARAFAADALRAASAAELLPEPEQRFLATRPVYEAMVAAGFLRKCVGFAEGENGGFMELAIVAEEFYSVNASVALTLFGTVLGLMPILRAGTPDQRNRLLRPFLGTSGAPLAAFCATEPGGSANAGAPPPGEGVRTVAKREGDRWIIDGRKKWISSTTGWDRKGADLLCVVCRTDPGAVPERGVSIIAVEGPAPGIVLERVIDSLGHRAHLLPQFKLDHVAAPVHNLIGEEGRGLALTAASFAGSGALVGMFAVGLLRAAFDFALKFARAEHRGGVVPIIEHQAIGYALADARIALESARLMSWRACHAADTRASDAGELDICAKTHGAETAVRVITDLMRLVGVDSYDHELPLGRLLQDALALPVFGGGNRRRQLHALLKHPDYDPLRTS
jgi:nitroalkane oxidase